MNTVYCLISDVPFFIFLGVFKLQLSWPESVLPVLRASSQLPVRWAAQQ